MAKLEKPAPAIPCVKKHVAAIHINGDLSLVERKLANVLLLNAYDDLLVKRTHAIPVSLLLAMIGWKESNNVDALQGALTKLVGTPIEFNLMNDGKVSWHTMAMVAYGKIENGICSYRYDEFLAEQLYNPEIYATINLGIQRLFESCYSLALYENCLRYKSVGSTGWWRVEKFRELVGATKKNYEEFRYLQREAIKKPVDEINRVSDIRLSPEFRREGRRIAELRFLVSEAPQQAALKPESKDAHAEIRESELFKRLRSHGIGARLAVAWVLQDEARARATVEYVEGRAKRGQVKGSTAGYIRTLFEGGAEVSKSDFEEGLEARSREAAESARRSEQQKAEARRAEADRRDRERDALGLALEWFKALPEAERRAVEDAYLAESNSIDAGIFRQKGHQYTGFRIYVKKMWKKAGAPPVPA
jgi:hypothetical protein